jgi:hypothetical protein
MFKADLKFRAKHFFFFSFFAMFYIKNKNNLTIPILEANI